MTEEGPLLSGRHGPSGKTGTGRQAQADRHTPMHSDYRPDPSPGVFAIEFAGPGEVTRDA